MNPKRTPWKRITILKKCQSFVYLFELTSTFGMSIFYAKIDNNITRSDKSNQQSAKYDWYVMIIIQISFILKKKPFFTEPRYWDIFYTNTNVSKSLDSNTITVTAITDCHWYTPKYFLTLFTMSICWSVIRWCRESLMYIEPQESSSFIGTDDIDTHLPVWLGRKDEIRKDEQLMMWIT